MSQSRATSPRCQLLLAVPSDHRRSTRESPVSSIHGSPVARRRASIPRLRLCQHRRLHRQLHHLYLLCLPSPPIQIGVHGPPGPFSLQQLPQSRRPTQHPPRRPSPHHQTALLSCSAIVPTQSQRYGQFRRRPRPGRQAHGRRHRRPAQ